VLMTNHVANPLFGASNYWLAFLMFNWNVMKWSSMRDKLTAPEPAHDLEPFSGARPAT